eukprot:11699843-Alexandrium_andersonii.AAC.1
MAAELAEGAAPGHSLAQEQALPLPGGGFFFVAEAAHMILPPDHAAFAAAQEQLLCAIPSLAAEEFRKQRVALQRRFGAPPCLLSLKMQQAALAETHLA